MGGPFGAALNERAGDDGEYHHSRNLTKNIDIGNKTLRDSNTARGEDRSSRRSVARSPRLRAAAAPAPRLTFAWIARYV